MTDADLVFWARVWMGVAIVIVLVVAALLIIIWRTARGIHSEAVRALAAAENIRANTMPIWALETTNVVAKGLLHTTRRIETNGGALASALEARAGAT